MAPRIPFVSNGFDSVNVEIAGVITGSCDIGNLDFLGYIRIAGAYPRIRVSGWLGSGLLETHQSNGSYGPSLGSTASSKL